MTTQREKYFSLHVTRIVIFLMGCVSVFSNEPLSQVLAVISLAAWLWLPSLVAVELSILDKLHKKFDK